jgi:uncharacterized protein YydD (DUF2326 family)
MKILLSKRNLKNWVEKLHAWPPILRTGVLTAFGFLMLLLIYLLIIEPLINLEEDWSREVKQKELELAHYQEILNKKNNVTERLHSLQTMLDTTNKQMLAGTNAAVAAADLQEILKNLLKISGAKGLAIKVMPPKERGAYLEVPIMVQLSGTIDQVYKILYQLEHNQKFLVITELDINVARREAIKEERPNLQADLIVAGMIKKGVSS